MKKTLRISALINFQKLLNGHVHTRIVHLLPTAEASILKAKGSYLEKRINERAEYETHSGLNNTGNGDSGNCSRELRGRGRGHVRALRVCLSALPLESGFLIALHLAMA